MGKCQSSPNEQQLEFKQQPRISNNSIFNQIHRDKPSDDFALPVKQIPEVKQKINNRLKQLGPFQYQNITDITIQKAKQQEPYQLQNNSIYVGQWKYGKPHGNGKYFLPDGSFFQGTSKNGIIEGNGRIIHQNGDYFQGQLKQGKAHGQGIYVQGDIIYNGQFKNNLQHGLGHESSPEYQFSGKYLQGQKLQGKLILKNKGLYEYNGNFKYNKFHGKGVLINDIGRYEGKFDNGAKNGLGKFIWNDESYYQGEYVNDQKHGKGKLFDKHGNVLKQGTWESNIYIN